MTPKQQRKQLDKAYKFGLRAGARVTKGYMCKVDYLYELGAAKGGNVIYPSVQDLKASRKCWNDCGIVEVEVRLKRIVKEGAI